MTKEKYIGRYKVLFTSINDVDYEVHVTDGDRRIKIPLMPDDGVVKRSLKRMDSIKIPPDLPLDMFRSIVAGAISITMKERR